MHHKQWETSQAATSRAVARSLATSPSSASSCRSACPALCSASSLSPLSACTQNKREGGHASWPHQERTFPYENTLKESKNVIWLNVMNCKWDANVRLTLQVRHRALNAKSVTSTTVRHIRARAIISAQGAKPHARSPHGEAPTIKGPTVMLLCTQMTIRLLKRDIQRTKVSSKLGTETFPLLETPLRHCNETPPRDADLKDDDVEVVGVQN